MDQDYTRRSFLAKSATTAVAAGLLPSSLMYGQETKDKQEKPLTKQPLPMIILGKTGRVLPRVGLGGYRLGTMESEEDAVRILLHAIDCGVRYLDTAPSYASGRSETRIGMAVKQCKLERDAFFIATKTLRRDGDGARKELEESLERLGVEYVDSIQVHAVHNDYESLFGDQAVLKGLEIAKDEGLIKHIGITAHANPEYLIKAVKRYEFDTALVPVNPIDTKYLSFVRDFLPVAVELELPVIAMKVYAGGTLLRDDRFTPAELMRYALSQPAVAVAIPGFEKASHVDDACKAMTGFDEPLSKETQEEYEERAGEHEGRSSEWYKKP